jgi:hypothetical protein
VNTVRQELSRESDSILIRWAAVYDFLSFISHVLGSMCRRVMKWREEVVYDEGLQ